MIGLLDTIGLQLLGEPTPPLPKRRYGKARKGDYGKRILRTIRKGGREYQLHATRGWRSYRIGGAA